MSEGQGKVYDVGYKPYTGEHTGRRGIIGAIVFDTMRRAIGIRRRGRAKIVPWLLLGGTILPTLFLLVIMFFTGQSPFDSGVDPMADNSELFATLVFLTMLFVAFIGPTALIGDRTDRVLNIYSSRPVRARDYLAGRVFGICLLVLGFMLIPQALLYIGQAAVHPDGVFAGLAELGRYLPALLGTMIGLVLSLVPPVFLVSLYAKRTGAATGMFMVALTALDGFGELVPEGSTSFGSRVLALGSPTENLLATRDWLLEPSTVVIQSDLPRAVLRAGLPIWSGAVAILVVLLVTSLLSIRRYRKELGA